MLYDLAQPLYNQAPQFPGQPHNPIGYQQLADVDHATVERVTGMTHSGSHVDAPFHLLPQLPCISELPLSQLYGPCIALAICRFPPSHQISADDLRKHEALLSKGIFALLETGWGEKRANTNVFLTAWPDISWNGAEYLLERNVKGIGLDVLSTGGYLDKEAESGAHEVLLLGERLLLEDIRIPDHLLDGKRRHIAASPVLIAGAGGAWVPPVVWDDGDLDRESPAEVEGPRIPASISTQVQLQRGAH